MFPRPSYFGKICTFANSRVGASEAVHYLIHTQFLSLLNAKVFMKAPFVGFLYVDSGCHDYLPIKTIVSFTFSGKDNISSTRVTALFTECFVSVDLKGGLRPSRTTKFCESIFSIWTIMIIFLSKSKHRPLQLELELRSRAGRQD